jgi:ATP/ADP translocase
MKKEFIVIFIGSVGLWTVGWYSPASVPGVIYFMGLALFGLVFLQDPME